MSDTLLLDVDTWDLCLDSIGNLAIASPPYATIQDVSTAARFFKGDYYYDLSVGIPYFERVLGYYVPTQYLKSQYVAAAKSVPNVASAVCYLGKVINRQLTGQIQVTDTAGVVTAIPFGG